MKRSDNLRLVFTAAHISSGLKSPLPKKAPFRLACKLNLLFHVLVATVDCLVSAGVRASIGKVKLNLEMSLSVPSQEISNV